MGASWTKGKNELPFHECFIITLLNSLFYCCIFNSIYWSHQSLAVTNIIKPHWSALAWTCHSPDWLFKSWLQRIKFWLRYHFIYYLYDQILIFNSSVCCPWYSIWPVIDTVSHDKSFSCDPHKHSCHGSRLTMLSSAYSFPPWVRIQLVWSVWGCTSSSLSSWGFS